MAGNHWESIAIDSFCVVIIRNTEIVTQINNKGQIFTPSTKAQMSKVAANDRVIIYAIYGRDYGDKKVFVPPAELVIE